MGDHHVHCPKPRRPPSFLLGSVSSFEEEEEAESAATFDVRAALDNTFSWHHVLQEKNRISSILNGNVCQSVDLFRLFNPTSEEINAALEKRFLPSKKTSAASSSTTSTVQESSPRIGDTERPMTTTDASSSNPHPPAANLHDTCLFPPLEDFLDDDDDVTETPVNVSPSEPNPAFQAFSMLRNDPGVQNAVASLMSDQNLWEAVMKNKKVMEYMESLENVNKIDANQSTNATATGGEIIPTDGSNANQSTTANGGEIIPSDDSSASDPISLTQAMKLRVLAIVRSLLELYQKIFGNPVAKEGSGSAVEESSSGESIWKYTTITAPIMVLTIAVIMVVMVKRE